MNNSFKKKLYNSLPIPTKSWAATLHGYSLKKWRFYHREAYTRILSNRNHWSKKQWLDWQKDRLKHILEISAKQVPYYRKYWEERDGFKDQSYLELSRWPILHKDVLRSNPILFINDNYGIKHLEKIQTSGTSGKPITHFFNREASAEWYAMYELRTRNWNGVSEQEWWGNIGGQMVVPVTRKKPPFWVKNYSMNQYYFSSYHISKENVPAYLKQINTSRITHLLGYTSSIYWLAYFGEALGINIRPLKLVIVNAEPLFDYQKQQIEDFFSCRVVQTYSSSERAFGGSDCEKGTLHYFPDAGIIEVVDGQGNLLTEGEKGRFIITGLINDAMPLIRYDVGDMGVLGKNWTCDCGRQLPHIKEVLGRFDDIIKSRNGRMIGRLDPVFKTDVHIAEAQIVQKSLDCLQVNLVPAKGYTSKDNEIIASRLKERVGNEFQIKFVIMEAIPRLPNGKFKAVISEL